MEKEQLTDKKEQGFTPHLWSTSFFKTPMQKFCLAQKKFVFENKSRQPRKTLRRCCAPKVTGFSLVEIVIGLAIFAVGASSILFLISQQQFLVSNKEQTMRAQTFVSEGLEATKAIAQKNWNALTAGNHGLAFANGEWQFSGVQDANGIFVRKIIITDIDSKSKQITNQVEWGIASPKFKVEIPIVLTNWESVVESGGGPGSGDPGLSGNWANPQTLTSVDLGAARNGTDVVVKNNKVYISSTASDDSKKDLSIYDVSAPANPTLLGELEINGKGINSLALSGNELFAASSENNQEFMVIDVGNPGSPIKIAQIDLEGDADALSIFYSNNFVYLGRKKNDDSGEFIVIDVNNSYGPQIRSQLETNADIEDIFVLEQKAYLANDSESKALSIVNVSNPDGPQEIGALNIAGEEGRSVFAQTPSRVFLGTENDFLVLDTTNPSVISLRGSTTVSANINDIAVVGNYAFLATSHANKEFITLNVATTTNIQQISSFNFPQQATGVDYENNLIFISVRSNDALRIITSQ